MMAVTHMCRQQSENAGSQEILRQTRPGRTPTSSTSEQKVPHAGSPWETGGQGKYQYYPGGDRSAEPKDAPSAVNTVVVPNVDLPKVRTQIYMSGRGDDARAAAVIDNESTPYIET